MSVLVCLDCVGPVVNRSLVVVVHREIGPFLEEDLVVDLATTR